MFLSVYFLNLMVVNYMQSHSHKSDNEEEKLKRLYFVVLTCVTVEENFCKISGIS